MDENVQGPITMGLRRRGIDVLTAQEDERVGWPDSEVLKRARELGRVLFTRDDDFLALGAGGQRKGKDFATIIFAHQQRVSYSQCLEDLEFLAKAGDRSDTLNQIVYLPL